jgi:hypothetical protein
MEYSETIFLDHRKLTLNQLQLYEDKTKYLEYGVELRQW